MSLDICNFCARTIDDEVSPYHPVRGLGGGIYTPICSHCYRPELGDITAEQYQRIVRERDS